MEGDPELQRYETWLWAVNTPLPDGSSMENREDGGCPGAVLLARLDSQQETDAVADHGKSGNQCW